MGEGLCLADMCSVEVPGHSRSDSGSSRSILGGESIGGWLGEAQAVLGTGNKAGSPHVRRRPRPSPSPWVRKPGWRDPAERGLGPDL